MDYTTFAILGTVLAFVGCFVRVLRPVRWVWMFGCGAWATGMILLGQPFHWVTFALIAIVVGLYICRRIPARRLGAKEARAQEQIYYRAMKRIRAEDAPRAAAYR